MYTTIYTAHCYNIVLGRISRMLEEIFKSTFIFKKYSVLYQPTLQGTISSYHTTQ